MRKRNGIVILLLTFALVAAGCGGDGAGEETKESQTTLENDYVKVGQYKGISYEDQSVEVTDEMVANEETAILEDSAEPKELDRKKVEKGDYIIFDYSGSHNGEVFDGGTAENVVLESVGDGGYIPGFEDNLIGAKVGETYDFNVTFPDPYENNTDLSGEECTFTITVHGIYEKTVPVLNDDFVQNGQDVYPDVSTVDEFRAALREDLVNYYKDQADNEHKKAIWDQIMDNVEIKGYDEDAVKQYEEEFRTYYENMAASQSLEFTDFLSQNLNITEEEFTAEATNYAKSLSTEDQVVRLIAEQEGLSIGDEEKQEAYEEFNEHYGMDEDAVINYFGSEENFTRELLYEKVLDLVYENGVMTQSEDEE